MPHGEACFLVLATKPSALPLVGGLAPYGLRRSQIISCLDSCLKPEQYRGLNRSLIRIWYQNCLRCAPRHHNTHQIINIMLWSADAQNPVTVSFLAALMINRESLMTTYWVHKCSSSTVWLLFSSEHECL